MPINIIFIIFTTLISIDCMANQPFQVVLGLSKPPYVIEENQTGFELELIKHVLTNIGKDPEFIFIPYGRSEKMLALPSIDAVMTTNKQMFPNSKNLSDSYINYQNVAISLKKNEISLNSISGIANYSIASFQLANKMLGEEFAMAVTSSPIFIQVANQENQIELLLRGRVDILVMDIKIFLHFINKLNLNEKLGDIQFHHIFPLSSYQVAFKKSEDVDAFNQALKNYKVSDKHQKLIEKYNF
jgi:polar amino acid transport system substrate-binding protein